MELWESILLHKQEDAARRAGLSADQSGPFRRRAADEQCVGVDEGETLPLPRREAGWRITRYRIGCRSALWDIPMNIWVELSQEKQNRLTNMLSSGAQAARELKLAQILLAADAGESDDAAAAANVAVGSSRR